MAPVTAHSTAIYYTFQPYTHRRLYQPANSVQTQPADHTHNHNLADPTKSKTQPKQTLHKAERHKGTKIYIYINI